MAKNHYGKHNQKVPADYDSKQTKDFPKGVGGRDISLAKHQIAVDHHEKRNGKIAEIIDRIIDHADGMKADYANSSQHLDKVKIDNSITHM